MNMNLIDVSTSRLQTDPALENGNQADMISDYVTKTYDFFYKVDNYDPVFNEKLEFDVTVTVQDAVRASLKVFNQLIK